MTERAKQAFALWRLIFTATFPMSREFAAREVINNGRFVARDFRESRL
jgi:hypothetical protein